MLRLFTARHLAIATFALCLAAAGQAQAQSEQSWGSPQGVVPSAQYVTAGCDDGCGHGHGFKMPKVKMPSFHHSKTVCTIPAGTVCEPAHCGPKLPKICMPKIHMPKICLPKIKMPSLCHKNKCDTGCDGGCGAVYATDYASPQGYATPQSFAAPQAYAAPQATAAPQG